MTVLLKPAVLVEIVNDHDLVVSFLKWQLDETVWPIGNTSFGRGQYSGAFREEDRPLLEEFFRGQS